RPIARPCGRFGSASGGGHRHDRGQLLTRGHGRKFDDAYRISEPERSDQLWLRGELQSTGWQCHRHSLINRPLVAKRLEIALQLAPTGTPVGYLMNPEDTKEAGDYLREAQAAAQAIDQRLIIVNASRQHDMAAAFAALIDQGAGALIVSTDPYLFGRRNQIIALAARHSLPTIYDRREVAAAGGLVTYGTHLADAYRQIGVYAGRILKGEKPADLPVVQPTKFELVINLGIAKALRLQVPDKLLALADEVIE